VRYQLLNKAAYTDYIPKILKSFKFERPYVHQFLGGRKRFIITYLDNMKAYEMPGIPPPKLNAPIKSGDGDFFAPRERETKTLTKFQIK